MPGTEDEIDRLFGLPLDEFTKARNDSRGSSNGTATPRGRPPSRRCPKPTVAAWTVNQLARHDAGRRAGVARRGGGPAHGPGRLLGGEDATDSLRDATAQEREAVRALSDSAEATLQTAGRPAPQAMLERVAATLRAAAVDDEGRRLLEAGRLTAELDPAGFGGLAGVPATASRRKPEPQKPSAADKRREREEEQRRRQELRQRARELERAARAAEREAEKAEAAAEKARRRAEQARAEADAAAEEARVSS